jgi:hypothetical protein
MGFRRWEGRREPMTNEAVDVSRRVSWGKAGCFCTDKGGPGFDETKAEECEWFG